MEKVLIETLGGKMVRNADGSLTTTLPDGSVDTIGTSLKFEDWQAVHIFCDLMESYFKRLDEVERARSWS